MKKMDIITKLDPGTREIVKSIQRRHLYIIVWNKSPMLIQVTHFNREGIRFKPLTHTSRGHLRYTRFTRRGQMAAFKATGSMSYRNLETFKIRSARLDEIPLYLNCATPFYTQALSNANAKYFKEQYGEQDFSCHSKE